MMRCKKILIVDDNLVIRKGLTSLLENEPDFNIVGEASTGAEAVAMLRKSSADVVLMDIRMPGLDGIKATAEIMRIRPKTKVLAVTAVQDDDTLAEVLTAGAKGCLIYSEFDPGALMESIRAIVSGHEIVIPPSVALAMLKLSQYAASSPANPSQSSKQASITIREEDVLKLMADGRTNAEIAQALGIKEKTVKNHVNSIYSKLKVKNRYQIISQATKQTP